MASKQRVICGLSVAAVWLLAIFALPIWALATLVTLSAGICLFELSAMLKKAGYILPFGWLSAATVGWFALQYTVLTSGDTSLAEVKHFALPVICATLFFRVLLDARVQKPMETACLTVVSFLYIPYMLSFLLPIAMQPVRVFEGVTVTSTYSAGIFLAFMLALVTKMSDTGGYFIGSSFGKHKMCPRLSPGKSWEGTAGGYGFSLIVAGIIVLLAHVVFPEATCLRFVRELTASAPQTLWFFLTVIVIVTTAICGDLLESLFKRQCGVKDSSALFPAMGGFFDTFDSIIFVPAVFLLMTALGKLLF